ncbi:hypothetical protein A3F62_00165 [Candidatus Woesebacteria bacterium RIFCSPHIGHO2_12_FULL_44_11]|uniref:Glycosyltransferase RgtA/B/C/D-like domain-containing protein n=1 Tax=Candidatus Woesebacteria bacterium RIFCSPLOWO2_01_FULL_44_14 TaxID=1802525 RepID=A0A1F8C2T5_9BACT|nr:MAG: hypothetical protein A3F62_00165 [Candidatus Woesebacteria bacterium RIFCSPHIGHO2_12_FULL_44_11]OGM69938.1 MAG: hypothetical protein A2975_05000 [Candidatus Woesebacteria bacterium RIFCSPLOWO2_01_FULL_44_14]
MRHRWLLTGIILLALALRVIGISTYPAGFSADEVGQGYTAYSILKTGKDEWGEFLPLAPRSYGDYRAPLYTYLTIPSVAIFGLTEFAVRLPNALAGTAAVGVVYFFVLEVFKKRKVAIFSAFLLAISPWHVTLSRGAFEPNLPTLLIPLGWLLFEKDKKDKWLMILSGLTFGLALFSYYSARFLVPVLVFGLLYEYYRKAKKLPWGLLVTFGAFALIAGYTMFYGGGTRSSDVAITSPTHGWGAVSDKRYEAILLGLPDFVSRAFNNKLTYTVGEFTKSYLSYSSPQFLFTNGAGEATYGMFPGQGLLYLIEVLFLGSFLVFLTKNFKAFPKLILLWLLIAPIPAALAKGPGFAANRVALAMPFVQIILALGAIALLKRTPKVVFLAVYSLMLVLFLENYFFHAPAANARSMSYGWREIMNFVNENNAKYSKIVVSRNFSEPQMFVAFYGKMDPGVVQKESSDWLRYEEQGLKFVDQLGEYSLGKFLFTSIENSSPQEGVLRVGKPEEFKAGARVVQIIAYLDGKPAILLVE